MDHQILALGSPVTPHAYQGPRKGFLSPRIGITGIAPNHIYSLKGLHGSPKNLEAPSSSKFNLQPGESSNSPLARELEKPNSGQANHIVYRVGGRA